MADEPKQPWYKSVPGTLTAATGLIAALSGLVAGLNQLGVFRREPAAPQTVVITPGAAGGTAVAPSTVASGGSSDAGGASAKGEESSTAPAGTTAPKPRGAVSRAPAAPSPAPAKPAPVAVADTAGSQRLPSGTAFELTVPARTCATGGGTQRFTARLAAPVRVGNATVLPANTTAVLRLRKSGSPTPDVRLDSLIRQKQATAVPASDVKVTRGAGGGCLRAGARLAVTLSQALTLRSR